MAWELFIGAGGAPAAACGVSVAKHGNRSASGKVGSADVLEGLGLQLKAPLPKVVDALRSTGITFLFAPAWHPALVNLAPLRRSLGIRTVFNPFFQVADNLGTCWIVREEMTQDFIILNGDTIVSDEIVAKLVEGAQDAITVTVDVKPQGDYDDDDMKVSRDADGRLRAIGKRLLPPDTNAESIGMLAFTGEGPAIFRNQIDQMMRTPEGVERWYLRAIDIIAKGNRVGTVSIEGLEWQEVDFPQDVEAAQALTAKWIAQGRYAR